MTPQQIFDRVNQEASVRFIEVIERMFPVVRNRHAHNACLKECLCDYCKFIQYTYTTEKINLHKVKVYIKKFEYQHWEGDKLSLDTHIHLAKEVLKQKNKVSKLKVIKNELKEEIL